MDAETIRDLTGIKGNMNATPKIEEVEQKDTNSEDKQQKGVLSKENGILLLTSTGMSKQEAEAMINKTEQIVKENE